MKKYKKNNRIITILLTVLVKLKVISGKILLNRFSKKLLVDLNLTGISKAIFTEKYREIDHTNIFSEKLIDKKKILDLGANIGYYMLLESEHADKDAKIICIEPDPRNTYLLKENKELIIWKTKQRFWKLQFLVKMVKFQFLLQMQAI